MATEGIKIVVDDAAVMGALGALQGKAENLAPAMAAIGAALLQSTQRRFERETGPDGAKWPRLSPRTAAKRVTAKHRRGHDNILRVTGRLYQSIVAESSETQAEVGTNVVYAAIHQLGGAIEMPEREQTIHLSTGKRKRFVRTSAKRKDTRTVKVGAHSVRIPARPFLGIDDADRQTVLEIVADHLTVSGVAP